MSVESSSPRLYRSHHCVTHARNHRRVCFALRVAACHSHTDVCCTRLGSIDSTLTTWQSTLTRLDLSGNRFSSLPESLTLLTSLQYLALRNNTISGLLDSFSVLSSLQLTYVECHALVLNKELSMVVFFLAY